MSKKSSSHDSDATPTIVEVAKAAGVSRMTVSRVLNGSQHVKPETARKVETALEQLGYRRNPMVQALMSQVRRQRVRLASNLAWLEEVRQNEPRERIKLLRDSAQARAHSLGFGFEVIYYEQGELSAQRLDSMLQARGVNGVIIAPINQPGAELDFPWHNYAAATIGRSLVTPQISYVMMHFQHAMERVLTEVRERGYRRVGLMIGNNADSRNEHLLLMAFLHHNYYTDESNRLDPLWLDGKQPCDVKEWIDSHQPDAIIGSYIHDWNLLKQLDLRTPEDVGFAALSTRENQPDVSGMLAPVDAMSAGVVDMVVAQIQRNECGLPAIPKCVLIEGKWQEGQTLRSR